MEQEKALEVQLVHIFDCPLDIRMKVRQWRNHPEVRRWMYHQHEISEEEHRDWLHWLQRTDKMIVFIAFVERDKPVAVVNLQNINWSMATADIGVYTVESGYGYGGSALKVLMDWAFDYPRAFERLGVECFDGNPALKLYYSLGFKWEGCKRSAAILDGRRVNVFILGLSRTDWLEAKGKKKPMELKDAIKILIEQTSINIRESGQGIRSLPSGEEREKIKEAMKVAWKHSYGWEMGEAEEFNLF
jgi:RimJ/RimL family protein N-acetyltransferase